MKREMRSTFELRADGEGDELVLTGYAALFNSESKNLGGFTEKIAPGAFTRSLEAKADVMATFNHDPNKPLGRTKSGTLAISQDERGLKWRCQLDPTNQEHRNIYSSVKRGDIDQCSFAFMVGPEGQQWADASDAEVNSGVYMKRTLTDVDLVDVSAVTYPAYNGTSVDARCLFPDGVIESIKVAVEARAAKIAQQSAERRAAEEQSLEDQIAAVNKALAVKYPPEAGEGCCPSTQYWTVETYKDTAIICSWKSGGCEYFQITYHIGDDGVALIGDELTPMEQTWVPAGERAKARLEEIRTKVAAAIEAKKNVPAVVLPAAPAARAHSTEHVEGDCSDAECACQNRDVDPDEMWDEEGDEDERAARKAELRKAGKKVRTKSVDGKNLPASAFAYVGDPEKTETWKLPIHDANHARNALARFNQTQGIPAAEKAGVLKKIKAAAKKFGIEVSDDDNRALEAGCPLSDDEIRARKARLAGLML